MSGKTDRLTDGGNVRKTWEKPSVFPNKYFKYITYLAILVFLAWNIWAVRITPARLLYGFGAGVDLLEAMFPPNFEKKWDLIVSGTIATIAMAFISTAVGVALGIPIAFLAAENLVPRVIYYLNRGLILVARAFHSLIVAIIVVKAVGFGPVAGIIALVIKTVGFFSRMLADETEDIDSGMLEAVRATGASRLQVFTFAVLPQVMPRVVGLIIYQWDINIRKSTIVGIVGAGGIGILLLNSFDLYDYNVATAILLIIIALVMIGEGVSMVARRRII